MTKATRARYTLEFKEEAVRLVTGGERVATVAQNLGLSEQTLHNWVKAASNGGLQSSAGPAGGFHDVTTDFIYPGRKSATLVKRSARTSFLPALRQRAGGKIRACPGQATMVVSMVPVPVHAS
jgi:transposase-like protein